MSIISVFPMKSTYVSSNNSDTNYFNSNKLKIANYCDCTKYTILNFPLSISDKCNYVNWYLYIPVNSLKFCDYNNCLNVSIICDCIDYSTITYNYLNKLNIYSYYNITIDKNSICKGYVLVDISPLVYNYLENGEYFLNIMLESLSSNFSLEFNKNDLNKIPKLIIDDENFYSMCNESVEDENCCNTCNEPVAIELSLTQSSGGKIIYNNSIIIFDNIVTKTPSGIKYLFESGKILITKKGYYLFQWELSIEGTTYIDIKSIGLKNNNTGVIYKYPVPKSIQGQIYGMALVNVNKDNQSFSLVNRSNGDILLSDIQPCASITVIRV